MTDRVSPGRRSCPHAAPPRSAGPGASAPGACRALGLASGTRGARVGPGARASGTRTHAGWARLAPDARSGSGVASDARSRPNRPSACAPVARHARSLRDPPERRIRCKDPTRSGQHRGFSRPVRAPHATGHSSGIWGQLHGTPAPGLASELDSQSLPHPWCPPSAPVVDRAIGSVACELVLRRSVRGADRRSAETVGTGRVSGRTSAPSTVGPASGHSEPSASRDRGRHPAIGVEQLQACTSTTTTGPRRISPARDGRSVVRGSLCSRVVSRPPRSRPS